jgi:hypothetical protein
MGHNRSLLCSKEPSEPDESNSHCEISGSHGGDYENYSLLRYSALMMEAVCASQMSVSFTGTTRRCIPEGCHLQFIQFPQDPH